MFFCAPAPSDPSPQPLPANAPSFRSATCTTERDKFRQSANINEKANLAGQAGPPPRSGLLLKKYYFCTVEPACMNHDRTYRPVRRVPAPRLRDADGSMRQAPCRSAGHAATHPVQPLKGLPGTRATDVSYRALAPGGAGF